MSETAPPATIDTGIFRAYDIRGITTENLTEEVVYWIGRSFATAALAQQQSTAVIGRDGRLSSPGLEASLTRGLCDGGLDVISVGLVPTPLLYFATYELQTGTGIMITGSHNPPEYNGLKMMIGGVTLAEERIQALLQNLQNNTLSQGTGSASEQDIIAAYTQNCCPPASLIDR
jgi:phosphomannomutase/phosphoglucomutase